MIEYSPILIGLSIALILFAAYIAWWPFEPRPGRVWWYAPDRIESVPRRELKRRIQFLFIASCFAMVMITSVKTQLQPAMGRLLQFKPLPGILDPSSDPTAQFPAFALMATFAFVFWRKRLGPVAPAVD